MRLESHSDLGSQVSRDPCGRTVLGINQFRGPPKAWRPLENSKREFLAAKKSSKKMLQERVCNALTNMGAKTNSSLGSNSSVGANSSSHANSSSAASSLHLHELDVEYVGASDDGAPSSIDDLMARLRLDDLNLADGDDRTPLDVAKGEGHQRIVEHLSFGPAKEEPPVDVSHLLRNSDGSTSAADYGPVPEEED